MMASSKIAFDEPQKKVNYKIRPSGYRLIVLFDKDTHLDQDLSSICDRLDLFR